MLKAIMTCTFFFFNIYKPKKQYFFCLNNFKKFLLNLTSLKLNCFLVIIIAVKLIFIKNFYVIYLNVFE